jgi:hypothetical protein
MDLPVMPPVKPMLAKAVGWDVVEGLFERNKPVHLEPNRDTQS